jgi:hypothetical protein
METVPSKQCEYLVSINAMDDLALRLGSNINHYDLIFIDGMSSLIIHNGTNSVLRFLNDLMIKVKKANKKAIYLFSHDTNPEIMSDISLFADKIQII